MRSKGDGTIVIRKREFINDLNGSNIFAWDAYAINPGLRTTFPWLSEIADRYESYIFRKLKFEYVPRMPSTYMGTIIMSVDYDANDTGPDTKAEQLAYSGTRSGPIWAPLQIECPVEDLQKIKEKFTRPGYTINTNGGPADLKTYDVGNVFFSTAGCYNSSGTEFAAAIGELWVEYEVELKTPQLDEPGRATRYTIDHTTVSTAAPFGTVNDIFATSGTHSCGCRADVIQEGGIYKLRFLDAFEGLVHVYQAASAVGNLIYSSSDSTVKSAASVGTTNNTTCAATNAVFKIKADAGQLFYAIWSAMTTPTTTRLSLVDAPYDAF